MYAIQKDIPKPLPNRKRSPYPFALMAIGDSFAIPFEENLTRLRGRIASAILNFTRRHDGYKFSYFTDFEMNEIRVWRID